MQIIPKIIYIYWNTKMTKHMRNYTTHDNVVDGCLYLFKNIAEDAHGFLEYVKYGEPDRYKIVT